MATANLYTFISLFHKQEEPDNSILPLAGIEIPRIQRDYAQGRNTPDVKRIRKRFLESLYHALVADEPIKLDFVYGNIDKNRNLVPLDGQQRLTTLFLLHWYIARHEGIGEERTLCLKHFSYRTRRSARRFCECLVGFTPDFSLDLISSDIVDQAWMPLDWQNDPTINAMLNMLDDIHRMFRATAKLWECLEQGAISFYFLPLEDMGLKADELYIKMNSRGKPLTEFEHFKAEWERAIKRLDESIAKRISHKVDINWTDMLWPYRGDNNIIDDEFVRYFSYLCSLIYYKKYADQEIPEDIFDLVQALFVEKEDALDNVTFIEKGFDCWCGIDIPSFFNRFLTKNAHEEGKSSSEKNKGLDVFEECCNNYGLMLSERTRSFSVGQMVLLYAFILYRQNLDSVSEQQWRRRLRIINNLIKNSNYELREDRLPALLAQTEEIVVKGIVQERERVRSFNVFQLNEEIEKEDWLKTHAKEAQQLYLLEDHPILFGAISIIGLDNLSYCDKFYSLFHCDWSLVNRALLTIGDYSTKISWRYQIGALNESSWISLCHQSRSDNLKKRREILLQLLDKSDEITNDFLQNVIDQYLATNMVYDWRYYLIKYSTMRPETFGMYYWYDYTERGKASYRILAMKTGKSLGGKNYNIFLKTLYVLANNKVLHLGEYAHAGDGDELIVENKGVFIKCFDDAYKVYDSVTRKKIRAVIIPQKDGVDIVDRVEVGLNLLKEILQ